MEFQSTDVKYLIFVTRKVENLLSGVLKTEAQKIYRNVNVVRMQRNTQINNLLDFIFMYFVTIFDYTTF